MEQQVQGGHTGLSQDAVCADGHWLFQPDSRLIRQHGAESNVWLRYMRRSSREQKVT